MSVRRVARPAQRGALALLGATLAGTASMFGLSPLWAQSTPASVTLEGSGAASVIAELVTWQDAMIESPIPVDMAYLGNGSRLGRSQFLSGLTDFTISGVPFTAAELASRPVDAPALISSPVSISAMSILVTEPINVGFTTLAVKDGCDPDDPDLPDPEVCYVRGVYEGPIRIPAPNLSAMALSLPPAYEQNLLALWASPAIATALGQSDLIIQQRPQSVPRFINRTEGSEENFHLYDYVKQVAPEVLALAEKNAPIYRWDLAGETFPALAFSRFGLETQLGVFAIASVDPATNSVTDTWTGNMTTIPTSLIPRMRRDYPSLRFREVEIQNKHGDFLTATPESVALAVAAGVPNGAAANDVPGGYPMVWLNRLYAPAGGLSPDDANAMAAMMRYLATAGQAAVVANGGLALTDELRAEALAAADEVIVSNCTADGWEVTNGGPGPFEVDEPAVAAIGTMKHCTVKAPPPTTTVATTVPVTTVVATTTTTTAPSTTTTTLAATTTTTLPLRTTTTTTTFFTPPRPASTTTTTTTSAPAPAPESSAAPPTEPPVDSTIAPETTVTPETTVPLSTVPPLGNAVALPLPLPNDGTKGFKKLGTFALGAGGFLAVRRRIPGLLTVPDHD